MTRLLQELSFTRIKKISNFWCKFTHLRQTYANLKWKDNYKTRVEIVLCDTASTLFLYQQMILLFVEEMNMLDNF